MKSLKKLRKENRLAHRELLKRLQEERNLVQRETLRKLRKERNLTQKEIGEIAGITASQYNRIENDKTVNIYYHVARAIAGVFGLSTDDVFAS